MTDTLLTCVMYGSRCGEEQGEMTDTLLTCVMYGSRCGEEQGEMTDTLHSDAPAPADFDMMADGPDSQERQEIGGSVQPVMEMY